MVLGLTRHYLYIMHQEFMGVIWFRRELEAKVACRGRQLASLKNWHFYKRRY